MWVSMVDATLNSNFPCASGTVAAAPAEASVYSPPNGTSSGVDQADGSKVVTFDTTKMHSSTVFAVCYAETDGTDTDSWVDTGLRLTVSKIIFHYGPYSTSFPVRQWLSPNVMPAINRMPQVADAIITYVGELANARYIAMVDASLNGNNPCVDAAVAGAAADTLHSGAVTASGKAATIPQATGKLLDATKTFTICYAETLSLIHI